MRALLLSMLMLMTLSGCVFTFDDGPGESALDRCLATCTGCCDENALCRNGTSNLACGEPHHVCSVCTLGESCRVNACRPVTTPTAAQPGDVVLTWSFGGQSCAIVRDVVSVRVDVPGVIGESFDCAGANAAGVTLPSVAPGTYGFTVSGLSAGGAVLYVERGAFTVNGAVSVHVQLAPTTGATGGAFLSWTFPSNAASAAPGCAEAGVVAVDVTLDGQPFSVACSSAIGQAVELSGLSSGAHHVSFAAYDATGFVYYRGEAGFSVIAGATVAVESTLDWAVGALPVQWRLAHSGYSLGCAQAGVSDVRLDLRDGSGALVYPDGVLVPCSAMGALFPFLTAGTYTVYAQARGGSGLFSAAPITVLVQAGSFPALEASSPTLVLHR